jgi:hypothetical protein
MKGLANTLAGTGALVWLILRRDRIVLPLWVTVLGLLPVAIANTLADLYPTAVERQSYLDIVTANPALSALYGHAFGSGLGALTAWRLGGTVLLVGLATLLTVIRHTRRAQAEERISSTAPVARAHRRCPWRGRAPGLPETRYPLIQPRRRCDRYCRSLVPITMARKVTGESEGEMMRKAAVYGTAVVVFAR